ncbi:MAG: hypothetical protein R3F62_25970 [Planctomycetota bacterium]
MVTVVADSKVSLHCFCGRRYAVPAGPVARTIRCGRCLSELSVPATRRVARPRRSAPPRPAAPAPDPYAPPTTRAAVLPPTPCRPAPGFRDRDLAAEGHVLAIGFWTALTGLFLAGFGSLSFVAMGVRFPLELMLVLVFGGVLVFLGAQLMRQRRWARIGVGVALALELLQAVVALLFAPGLSAGLSLGWVLARAWALFGERGDRVFRPDYQVLRQRDARWVHFYTSVFFLVPLAVVLFYVGLIGAVSQGWI